MEPNPAHPRRRRVGASFLLSLVLAASSAVAHLRAAEMEYREVEHWAQLPAGDHWATMTAVDIDAQGAVYVLQRGQPSRVMVFDSAGKLLRTWGERMFPNAHGLRIDPQGNVWITDRKLQQVLKFSPDGKLLLELGRKNVTGDNNSTTALNGPSDVAFGRDGSVFVTDGESTNTRVVKFSADGRFIKFWGTKGSGPGQLDVPHAIATDSEGRLFVADRSNKRIELFDQDGGYLGQITNAGTPYGIDIAKDDLLYTADGSPEKNDVTVLDLKDGKTLAHFGGLNGPHMLAVDANGAIYIAETTGATVRKFVRQ